MWGIPNFLNGLQFRQRGGGGGGKITRIKKEKRGAMGEGKRWMGKFERSRISLILMGHTYTGK